MTTSKDKKRYLKQYQHIDRRIEQLEQRRARAFDMATRITPNYSDAPKSDGGRKIESAIELLDDIDRQIAAEYERLVAVKHDIITAIIALPDLLERQVLTYAYIGDPDPLSLTQIAFKMHYSLDYVIRIHGHALQHVKFAKKL